MYLGFFCYIKGYAPLFLTFFTQPGIFLSLPVLQKIHFSRAPRPEPLNPDPEPVLELVFDILVHLYPCPVPDLYPLSPNSCTSLSGVPWAI